jgi:hypothetical protein
MDDFDRCAKNINDNMKEANKREEQQKEREERNKQQRERENVINYIVKSIL